MKKTTKLLCLLLSVSLILSCLPAMAAPTAIAANGVYCDFGAIPERAVGAEALDSSHFTGTGLAFADKTDGIAVETQSGRKGLHLYSSASVGAALPTAVTTGKVKVTVNLYPAACATYIYLASSMGSSLDTSTKTQIAKFGSGIFVGTSATSTQMSWANWNRVELIIDLDKKTLDGYLNGTHLEQLTGLDISTAAGVIVGGNATVTPGNKPLIGDLGISTYTEDNTFSYVSSKDSVTDNVHTTTIMFDEPVKASTLAASAVTITPCTGGAPITADSASAHGPAVTLTWTGEMSVGTEYRIDFGSDFRSTYNRPLDDAAYLIKTASTSTKTLIDEDFDDLTTQGLDVTTAHTNSATGIYQLGSGGTINNDVVSTKSSIAALCFGTYHSNAYDEPRYIKMPHSDSAHPYTATDPFTAADGNYAAVPYQGGESDYTKNRYYRIGDLTQTDLGGMPESGIVKWSFDYLWEYGSGSSSNTSSSLYLKWAASDGAVINNFTNFSLSPKANDTNSWTTITIEYDAAQKKLRTVNNSGVMTAWQNVDMSECGWLVIDPQVMPVRLAFAVDNVRVTYTNTPMYVEGIRYVARDGSVTGAPSIQAETDKINIYFSAAVTNDIASHITINGVEVSDYTLSFDGKIMTVNTGLFKAGSTVTLAIDASAASAAGNIIDAAKTYTLTTGAGRFALENLSATVTAATEGTISTGDKVNVTADIINTSGEYDGCTLICAYYTDDGNTLVYADVHTVDLTDTYWAQEDHDFTPTAVGEAYDTVKVFAWDSLTGAIPLVVNLTK
ncbi:MAG: hypothetical protein IKV73_08590 [Clostridia bacterium]|nr:hypothetical protein [Clostridia bacterium]